MSSASYLTVDGLAGVYSLAATSSAGRGEAKKSAEEILGKDAFLRLLTTQLRYQDPFKPIDDHDFIAQMAQFTALEQMQNLTRQFELFMEEERAMNRMAQATALLGRKVEVAGESDTYTGTVEAIRMIEGVPFLVVQGILFSLGDVVKVLE